MGISGFACKMRLPVRYYLLKPCKSVCILSISLFAVVFVVHSVNYQFGSAEMPLELVHYRKLLRMNQSSFHNCEVPQLNPWDPSIMKYYKKPYPLECVTFQSNVTVLDNGVLRVLEEYRDGLTCRCRTFEHFDGVSDSKVLYDEWGDIDPVHGKKITKDFVEVECYSNGIIPAKKYSYHWNQIVQQNVSVVSGKPFMESSTEHPSVLLFGVDSMSRSNVIRILPKLHQQLMSMGFVDMVGHVKIGDNTFQNWAAFLTGKRSSETREFKRELPDDWYIYFDDWPFIWKNFSESGYVTMFAEDRPDIATYNYLEKLYGFKFKPTDHYFRPYWLEIFWNLLKMRSKPFCYDIIPTQLLQLNYLKEFLHKYNKKRSFAFYWSQELSHEYLNQVGMGDENFARFFQDIEPYITNTIVIVVSDHGHRFDSIRETIIGRLESRMPYLSIFLPKSFQVKYPTVMENIRNNSKKLTTHFDLYETLMDIASANFVRNDGDGEVSTKRAYSLFGKIPSVRRCFEANIPEDYCPCFDEVEIPKEEAIEPARVFLNYVNGLFTTEGNDIHGRRVKEGYRCLELSLDRILYASIRLPPLKVVEDPQVSGTITKKGLQLRYRVVIKAQRPSGAILEGIVMRNLETKTWLPDQEIERNNKYGNTSHCVVDSVLKKICYCINAP